VAGRKYSIRRRLVLTRKRYRGTSACWGARVCLGRGADSDLGRTDRQIGVDLVEVAIRSNSPPRARGIAEVRDGHELSYRDRGRDFSLCFRVAIRAKGAARLLSPGLVPELTSTQWTRTS
jgi:hypothetical protein